MKYPQISILKYEKKQHKSIIQTQNQKGPAGRNDSCLNTKERERKKGNIVSKIKSKQKFPKGK